VLTLKSTIECKMDCPKEIVLWNYWDHEHVVGTHYKSYSSMRVLAERDNWCLSVRHFKLPYIPIPVSSLNFQYMVGKDIFHSIHIGKLGNRLSQVFTFTDLPEDHCLVKLESKMELPGFFRIFESILQPLFVRFTTKWFYTTWDEDHPMRLRRWKVWKLGFKDFQGIDYIEEKTERPAELAHRPYPHQVPVPKSTLIASEGQFRPFSKSIEVGYGLQDL
jgi:hypothetical protein